MNKNVIAFQKGLVVVPNNGIDNRNLAMMCQAELMRFGYMLDSDALEALGYTDAANIKDFYNEVLDYLKEMTGGQRDYQPIYKGFPTQVIEMSEQQLWFNQLLGYWSGGSFTANEWTRTKSTAFEQVKYRPITLGTEQDFANIFTSLAKAGTSLTPADLKVLEWFVAEYPFLTFPESIPFKENLCTMIGKLITTGRGLGTVQLPSLTSTDVLRIIVYLSGGDVSLPAVPRKTVRQQSGYRRSYVTVANPEREKFKFKKFKRAERKFILELLEKSSLDVREMKLKDQRWVRIGEILHPGEYKALFPRAYKAFDQIRNEKVVSWYGEVTKAFSISANTGITKLAERPGEFLRRLDFLVRTANKSSLQLILNLLAKIGAKASNKVLFEVFSHFEDRRLPSNNRKVMIKGARKHTNLPSLPAIAAEKIDAIQSTIFDIIKGKFADLPALGDCWIDEELKKIPLPTNMRSLNDSLVPVIRGQRTPFGEGKKVIRPFIHWYDQHGDQDLDLHGFLIGPKGSMSFGYNGNQNVPGLGCYSGDVRHRQGACAEYVDIVVDEAVRRGYNYFIMVIHNFQGGKLSDLKECVAGVMERQFPESNKTWKPDTIQNSMLLKSAGNMVLVAAYDLVARESIYLDLDYDGFSSFVYGQSSEFFDALKPYISLPKVSVYDLLQWHVEARGRVVSKETAETHFLFDDFASSYVKTMEYMGI